jgi:uncharacterized protein (DUF885 family)
MPMRLAYLLAFAALPLAQLAAADFTPAAAQEAVAAQSQSERLHAWFEAKYEEQLQFSPLELSQLGRKDRYGELDDFSIEAQDEQLAWQKATVEELERSFDYDTLSPSEQLSYDLWKYGYERAAERARWRTNDYVFTQMQGMHTTLPTLMITLHRVDTEQDMRDYISRVGQFERALGQLVDQAEANAAKGVRPPYFAYETVIAESRGLIDGAPFGAGADTALWQDGKAKIAALVAAGKIDEARADALRTDLSAALTGSYLGGYQRIIAFMEADRPNAGAVARGAGSLPDGEAYYASQLKAFTTTDLAAEQVHQIGLDEIARIRGEMETIKNAVGFEGDLQAFFEHIKTAEWNHYPDNDAGAQAYIADATAAIDNIERELPNYFGLLPKAGLEVRRVEPFREQDGAAQHYRSGTPDGSRPGIYYAHLSDMKAMPKNQLEVIAYHEGLPGHHMQISIAQELQGVPTFQTQFGLSAYSEGWGLYAEKLAKEMPNTYVDPYADFGRLSSEIWRAIRLVVDTGLHAKGWSEEQAIAVFEQNSPEPLEAIRSEVRRYIVWPGQATSYKIGMLKIEELRAEAERELGSEFDIRGFHDTVLGSGAMPLSLLERRVRAWIAEQKAG